MTKDSEQTGGKQDLRARLTRMGKAHEREATARRSDLERRLAIQPMTPIRNDADERVVDLDEEDAGLTDAADPR